MEEKWSVKKPLTAIYHDSSKKMYYIKRFIIENENKNPILRNTLYTEFTETKNTLEKR